MRRLPQIIPLDSESNDTCPYKRETEDGKAWKTEGGYAAIRAEDEVMWPQATEG